jgi:oligoendopeptidase F
MVKWNLDDLYSYDEKDKYEAELTKQVNDFAQKKDLLTQDISPSDFVELVKEYEKISQNASVYVARPGLAVCINSHDDKLVQDEQDAERFVTLLSNKLLFFSHFFKDLPDQKAQEIIDNAGVYKFYLESLRKAKPYMRSEKEEQLLNIKEMSGSSVHETLRQIITAKFSFTVDGKEQQEETTRKMFLSEQPSLRKEAYDQILDKYEEFKSELGEIYKGIALDWANDAIEIRGHSSSLHMRTFDQDVDEQTVHTMFKAVDDLAPIYGEYFQLKADYLGYENSRYHAYAPVPLKDKKEYDFETVKQLCLETYKAFDDTAYELAKNIFDHNHIDTDITKGRRMGGFMYGADKKTYPYIFMNCTQTITDVSTLAHELGHAIHSQLSGEDAYFYDDYSLCIAEVASTFGELLLFDKLMNEVSEEEQKFLLFHHIDDTYRSINRQSMFCQFEIKAHDMIKQGTTVTALTDTYNDIIQKGHPGMKVPYKFAYEWLSIPHIYQTPFYVYSYSFAQLVAIALYQEYVEQGKDMIPKFYQILKRGSNGTVEEILGEAGFDVRDAEFWKKGVAYIEKRIADLSELMK